MLQELQTTLELLKINNETKPYGSLTTISSPEGISHCDSISLNNENNLYAVKVYVNTIPETFFIEIDSTGSVKQVLKETEGTLPVLFNAPNKSIWSINTCITGNKESESILPFKNRQEIKKEYKYRPFVGDWIGNVGNQVFFQNKDYFGSKPDQLCILEFKDNVIKKREIVKILKPNMNQIYFDNQEEFQLIAWENGNLMHRSTNNKGKIINERMLNIGDISAVEALAISFSGITELIGFNNNILFKITIHPNGQVIKEKLLELESEGGFYKIWKPQRIDSNKFIIQFTGENYNGWAVFTSNIITECFVCFKDSSCYKDILSNSIIELPNYEENNYLISRVCANMKGYYQIVVYNSKNDVRNVNNLFIISR